MSNTSRSVTRAVAEAYLAITQDISQSLEVHQLLSVSCNSKDKKSQCNSCLKWWFDNLSTTNATSEYINKMCEPVCNCNVKNVDMSQAIVVNFQAFLRDTSKQDFFTQVTNSISQAATQENSGIIASNTKNSEDTINDIFTSMQSDTIQTAIQSMTSIQLIYIEGTSSIAVVDMNQAIDFISNILESNSETQDSLDALENNVIQASTQISKAGLDEVIEWIVQIILFVILLFALFYTVNLIFEVFIVAL